MLADYGRGEEGKGGRYGRGTKTSTSAKWQWRWRSAARRRSGWRTARGRPRRRSWRTWWAPTRQAAVFPQKESLQVLRREDRLHRLQARGHSVAVRAGTRQDSAPSHDRRLRAAPTRIGRGHQARAQYRFAAVLGQRCGHAGASRSDSRRAWRAPAGRRGASRTDRYGASRAGARAGRRSAQGLSC